MPYWVPKIIRHYIEKEAPKILIGFSIEIWNFKLEYILELFGIIFLFTNSFYIMVYIPIITAIVSGLLVWALGRWSVNKEDHKQEKKKLNRLLYNILELKHWVDKQICAEEFISHYTAKMISTIKVNAPDIPDKELTAIINITKNSIKQLIFKQSQLTRLEQNIAEIIKDYSEIDPFFAFDLTGKYQLTEYLELMKMVLNDIVPEDVDVSEVTNFVNQQLQPSILDELQKDLIVHLPQIAKMAGSKATKKVSKDHLSKKVEINEQELENYCQKMLAPHNLISQYVIGPTVAKSCNFT